MTAAVSDDLEHRHPEDLQEPDDGLDDVDFAMLDYAPCSEYDPGAASADHEVDRHYRGAPSEYLVVYDGGRHDLPGLLPYYKAVSTCEINRVGAVLHDPVSGCRELRIEDNGDVERIGLP
jgi:hypothetical protein